MQVRRSKTGKEGTGDSTHGLLALGLCIKHHPAFQATLLSSLASVAWKDHEMEREKVVALDAGRDFDLGLSEDFGKEAERAGGVKLAFATSESMSVPKRKKGRSFMISLHLCFCP